MVEKLTENEALTSEQKDLFKSEIEAEAERRYRELKQISGFWKALSYDSYNVCLGKYAFLRGFFLIYFKFLWGKRRF